MVEIRTVGVAGIGTMGAGFAIVAARAGFRTIVFDTKDEALLRARRQTEGFLGKSVARGKLKPQQVDRILADLVGTTRLDDLGECDIVIEAVFEDLDVKHAVFRELDKICKDGAVLGTNTSALPITQIAAVTQRPESVVGTHFFSPVPMMALCELVRGYKTSDSALAAARAFAEEVGKTCIVVNRDVAGFVTTRLIAALTVEAVRLLETGVATAEDIDLACKLGFGHAMGPLATADLTGVDIMRNAGRNIYNETHDPKFAVPELLNRMVTAGALGRKTGKGFYDYEG
jgi:3-hydroxybutyryl-CoA dehydrogenase